jgi:hypothetical protein
MAIKVSADIKCCAVDLPARSIQPIDVFGYILLRKGENNMEEACFFNSDFST